MTRLEKIAIKHRRHDLSRFPEINVQTWPIPNINMYQ